MAKLVFGLSRSLDGYVDHLEMGPGPALFRHFVEVEREAAGSIYGRRVYEIMQYWEEDDPEWTADEREFALVWRRQPKWVAARPTSPASGRPSVLWAAIKLGKARSG
jgi:hypothetical protein